MVLFKRTSTFTCHPTKWYTALLRASPETTWYFDISTNNFSAYFTVKIARKIAVDERGISILPLKNNHHISCYIGSDLCGRWRLLYDDGELLITTPTTGGGGGGPGLGGPQLLGQLDPLVDHAVTVDGRPQAAPLPQVLQLRRQEDLP